MSLKSRSVFKNFSAVFLSLFVIIAVFVPLESAKALELFSFDIFSSLVDWTAKLVDGDSSFMTTIYWFLYRMISLGLYVTTVFVYFGSWLIDIFLDENIYSTVLNMNNPASAVSIGWTTVRDACNTFFILFLLLIAFSTILRIQTYSAKSLLPKLIISLFLINFSAVIAMMVIDCGQVFMFEIKTWMGAGGFSGASGAGTSLTSIVDYFYNEYGWHKPPPSGEYLMEDVVGVAFAVVYSAILGCLYIMLALFLMVRVIVFVILIIISPFAFFSIILPGMRTYTSQWWQSLVSHAIFGPVFLFFIYLSGKMAQSMQAYTPLPTTTEIAPLSHIIAVLIPHVVAIGMLMAAIPVTQKLGVAGSSKIIGGVGGIGKVGIGAIAGAKLAGGGLKKAGGGVASRNDFVGRNVDKVKGGYYKVLEKGTLGLGRGAAMKGRASMEKSKEEKMKKLEVDFGDLKSIDLEVLEKKANGALGTTDDKALWLKAAAARGKLGENEDTAKKFMTGAERSLSGKEISEVTDKSLVLATHTSEAQRSGKKDEEIMREKMNDIVEDGKASKVQGLDNELAAKVWHDSQNSDQRRSSINSMSDKQRKELAGGYLKNANKEGVDEENKKEFSSNAVKLGEGLKESFAWGGNDAAAKIKEAFLEFDHKTVAKLSSDDLDEHGYSATDNQIKGLNKAGEYKTVRRIKASMEKHAPERFKRVNNSPTNPTDKGSGDGGGTKPEEPGERWRKKMEEKTGGGNKSGGEAGGSGGSGEAANPKSNPKPNKSRKPFWKDESAEVGLTGGESSDEWLKEDLTPSEQRRSDSIEARQDKYWDNNLDRYDKTNEELDKGYKIEDSCKKNGSGMPKDAADKLKAAEGEWKNIVKEEGAFRKEWKKLGEEVMDRKGENKSGGESGGSGGSGETNSSKSNSKSNKSRKPFWKDESAEVGLTGSESSSVADGNIGKDVEKREQNTLEKTGASEKKIDKVIGAFSHDPIIGGKTIKAGLKVGGKFDKRIKTVGEVVSPLIDDEMKMKKEIKERRKKGEEISPTQEFKEKLGMVKEPLKAIVSENADEGVETAGNKAGAALNKIGERGGKLGAAAKVASKVVESEQVRKAVSEKVKRSVDQDKNEESEKTNVETKEQPKTGTLKKVVAGGNLGFAKNMAKGKDPVATNEALLKALEVSGKFDKRAKKIEPVVRPMIEKQLEIDKRRQGGEKISQWQEDKEKLGALKGGLKKIMPKDTKNDGKYVEEVGKLLSELGKEKGGKVGAVMTGAGKVLQNEKAQKVISKEARNRIDKVETPKQPKPKQQTVKETEQEKIIETRESATKKGGKVEKSSVVKSEITFDPNVSAEMAEQIKEAMRGVSNDMTQKINNKIEVNSPQEAVDIDFEKIIDADKIAEIVKKGIDIKDVEKTFKDVKKSFDEFKGNNNESSSTTVFGAGISAAQTALDKTLTIKDRKERDIKLATITKVMNEIKSGMKKQNRPSIKKEE